ncbi:MAG: hypothetical protein JW862_06720 [Anaerolineales bacterium]|nr:hypothetical protein [Anaerolineales bacterium]
MEGRYRSQYRTASTRLTDWDYGAAGYYFVTICGQDQRSMFGAIQGETLIETPIGRIAHECWKDIPEHFPNACLDEFVIMPNHVHGIVILRDRASVETLHATSLQPSHPETKSQTMSRISPKAGSLSTIIRSYKSAVTRQVRLAGYTDFAWQRNYYEHIIRDTESLHKIREYIQNNPLRWTLDEYFRS